jgi:NhaA family Na+:H+ antiporter
VSDLMPGNRLDRSVDDESDHVLGPADAPITLVEYGSYACPYCRAANERIAEVRDQFGDRMRYVFRHRPLTGVEIARRAAELVERAPDPKRFWEEHIKLMTRSETLTEERSQSGRATSACLSIAARQKIRPSSRRRGSMRTRPAPRRAER